MHESCQTAAYDVDWPA